MTSANKHRDRSHRNHQATQAMLGTLHARRRISRASKQIRQTKFQAMLTSVASRLKNLSARLSDRFTQAFRKQDR
jgi:division protein CdvB (Snf7/Vps24/ESCRT-III family)